MPGEKDIARYRTEHLFLLIGGNPLPNYVAAKLLTTPNAKGEKPTIHLIFSQGKDGTEKYAMKLREVLGEEKYNLKNLPVNPARQSDIYNKVKDRVAELKNNGVTSIGLNYTGGTKAMAVHAYRALKETCGDSIKPRFSYLDSLDMKMCIDREDNKDRTEFNLYDPDESYFEDTKISLDNLLTLHGLEKKDDLRRTAKHPDVMNAIYNEVTQNLSEWENFVSRIDKPPVCLTGLMNLPTALDRLGLIESGHLVYKKFSDEAKTKEFQKYLRGKWLEDFVLERIVEIKQNDNAINDYGASLSIVHPQDSRLDYFETDNVVVRGYQLFIITCSYILTKKGLGQKKSPYKEKIFEALLRAEQLGGSEARVALVCMASNAENHEGKTEDLVSRLKQELDDKRIAVFGKENILDKKQFTNELRGWFEKR